MSRLFLVVLIFVLGLCAGLAVLAYFAYGLESGPPPRASVAGLEAEVVVSWASDGASTVAAASNRDAWVGLGYAQAAGAPWPLTLYRAAALGNLTAIVGEQGLEVDRVTVALRLGQGAHEAFATLPVAERENLEAFAAGVNAALSDNRILRDPAMIFGKAQPQPWEAWHSVAIERMFAWLGAESTVQTSASGAVDSTLRHLLRLHDFDHSLVVQTLPPVEVGIYVRYVWGSSALPALFETTLATAEQTVHGACILGTPFMIAGRRGERMWAFLLSGRYELVSVNADSLHLRIDRFRRLLSDGSERLVTVERDSAGVLARWLRADTLADANQALLLSWRGLRPLTDAKAWFDLAEGREPSFQLIDGTGTLVLDARGNTRVGAGSDRLGRGVAFSNSEWKRFAFERLDSVMAASPAFQPRIWFSDAFSGWAARSVPALVAAADTSWTGGLREAVTYLRNWDYTFDRSSIAASIFASWAQYVRGLQGSWPFPIDASNVEIASRARQGVFPSGQLHRAEHLARSAERMFADYGPDLSTWRWERVNASTRYYPVLGTRKGASSRFPPVSVPGRGHPSTPEWGPPAVHDPLKPSHLWEGWAAVTSDDWTYRRPHSSQPRTTGDSAVVSERGIAISLKNKIVERETTLTPER